LKIADALCTVLRALTNKTIALGHIGNKRHPDITPANAGVEGSDPASPGFRHSPE
jgi:hypothetical protein